LAVTTVTNQVGNSAVTNAVISSNGVISWTPGEVQGPGVYVLTTVVSDGSLSATNSFTVTVNEVNTAPTLPNQTNLTISGTASVVVTNTASDSDIPVNPLGYQLTGSPPLGASIDANGIIRWTPTVNQVPGVYTFTTVVTDTNVFAVNAQDLTATNTFTVTVQAIHNGPGLGGQSNRTNDEQVLLVVTNSASDSDVPPLALSYTLAVTTVTNQVGNSAVTNAVISSNGVISWTPGEVQGPGVYVLTTVVSDGSLSATNSFTVTVNEVNTPPTLTLPPNTNIVEQAAWSAVATATDSDIPANPLTFALVSGPAGLTVTTNGLINWTPTQAQALNTYTVTISVTDTNPPAVNAKSLSVTNSFQITVNVASNDFRIISITTTNGVATVTWTSVAGNYYRLQYKDSLTAATWTDVIPDVQATSQTASTTNVLGNTTQRFYRVMLVPNGPNLPNQSNLVVNEQTQLLVTNSAVDHSAPPSALSYTLVVTNVLGGSTVTNASISTNGIITWTPTEAQGPGTNVFTTVVSDGSLSATNSFVVTVNEVNVAPVLLAQGNLTISGLTGVVVTNTASDSDIPVNPLGYVLTGPLGSTIDTNGIIRWTPTVGQVPGVYTFTTVVTDTNIYAVNAQDLSATNSFTVTVNAIHNGPSLPSQTNVTVNELTLLTVTNTAIDNDIPSLPLTYTLVSPPAGAVISTNGVITWTPNQAQAPGASVITTVVSDGSLSATNSFVVTVTVASNDFRIISITTTNGVATVTWTSVAGNYYRLQYKDSLTVTNWNSLTPDVQATNQTASMTNVLGNATQRFYRVMLVQAANLPQPIIQSIGLTNGITTIVWSALPPHVYRLQYNGNLNSTNWSSVVPDVTATSQTAVTTDIVGVATQRFYRVLVVQ
jgi:hypothetical protein